MKGKKYLLIVFILICLCIFFGCNNNSFDKLVIVGENVTDVPEGEYTLIYSIKDYEKLSNYYSMTIKVKAFDQNNVEVAVKNNRIINVETDYVYTIVVYCSTIIKGENVTKIKQFTVSGQKSPPSVNFILKYENIKSLHKTIVLEYDESLPLSEVPIVPDWHPDYKEGIEKVILSRKWVVYIDGTEHDLQQSHLNNITTAVNVYGIYTFKINYVPISYIFESNGGTNTPNISGLRDTSVNRPANPTKNGYTFDCWYTDIELTTPYDWKNKTIFLRSYKLYAKWLKQVDNYTDYSYFNFVQLTDDNNNKYYEISAKNPESITTKITIPNGKDNIPIKKIPDDGFRNCKMSRVFIPNSITVFGQNSFENCVNLNTITFEKNNAMQAIGWYSFKDCSSLETINLPQQITNLGRGTFINCASLKSITIPDSVEGLLSGVFMGCSSLITIDVPDSVHQILDKAFADCTQLVSISFTQNSNCTFIDKNSLDNTEVVSIKLPYFFKVTMNSFAISDITITYFDAPPPTIEE